MNADLHRYRIRFSVFFLLKIQIAADVLAMENARNGMDAHAVKLERFPKWVLSHNSQKKSNILTR
jgi:hypothetical protein